MRLHFSIALATLLASLGLTQAAGSDAGKRLGELFCQLRQGVDETGVRYLLTKGLVAEIDAAYAKNEAIAKAAPDEKPPLGDGVPFQSFPDVAPVCRPGAVAATGAATQVDIEYVFPEAPDANWTDRIVVQVEDGLPRVDDVLYGSDKYTTGLRKALVELFANP